MFSKILVRAIPIGLTLAALALVGGITNVQATPTCTTNTIVLPGGNGSEPQSALTAGVCVQVGDKLYGNFVFGPGLSGGEVTFSSEAEITQFVTTTIGFRGNFVGGTFTPINYEVEKVTGPICSTCVITQLTNAIVQTEGTSNLVQTTVPAGSPSPINITQTNLVLSGNPTANFSAAQNVTDLEVHNTFVRALDSNATGFTNDILQQRVPEPASGETLVLALAGLAFGYRKLKSRWS